MWLFILRMRQPIMRILPDIQKQTVPRETVRSSIKFANEWPSHAARIARIEHENREMAKAKETLERNIQCIIHSTHILCKIIIIFNWLWMPPGLAQPMNTNLTICLHVSAADTPLGLLTALTPLIASE